MKDSCYLVIDASGVKKMRKTPPALRPNEISLKINLMFEDDIFETPKFERTVEIAKKKPNQRDYVTQLEFELNQLKERDKKK